LEDSKSPSLASSFVLPKVYPINQPHRYETNRNMLGRSDVACQHDLNLRKLRLDGLSEYQKWSSDEVEPFLKVRTILNTHDSFIMLSFQIE
jgi:hypothetical protein